ncbi:MAG: superinfection exclusion protein [Deltaproteobacteria bacterium]|nr:superinfection exclusion protein [Deltaproteobacteria bacterium]
MRRAGSIYRHFASKFPVPKLESLRVWWIPQIPGKAFEWPVADLAQAALLLDALAAYDDFQFGENVKGDYCNTGGLQIFDGSDWVDWEDEDADGFDEWRDKQKAAA